MEKIRKSFVGLSDAGVKNQYELEREWGKSAGNIERYIATAPKWNGGPIYRGVPLSIDTVKTLKDNGSLIGMGGTSSWSSTKGIADAFVRGRALMGQATGGSAVVFRVSSTKQGTSIKHLSIAPVQNEVLVSKNAQYRIGKIAETGTVKGVGTSTIKTYVVDLTEI